MKGSLDYKISDIRYDVDFLVKINDEQFSRVEALFNKWGTENYDLFGNNCSRLAEETAKIIGLNLPNDSPGSTLPFNYIKKLKSEN